MVLVAAEAVLSGRCCLVALIFRGIGPCARGYSKEQVRAIGPDGSPCLCPAIAAFLLHFEAAGFCWALVAVQTGRAAMGG